MDGRLIGRRYTNKENALTVQVYLKAGFPVLRRSGFLQSLQSWLQRVGTTTDFQYIMLSAMFLPQQSVSLVGHVLAASMSCCCFWLNSWCMLLPQCSLK